MSKKDVVPYEKNYVDPAQVEAMNIIASKRVPPKAKKQRPGKGGQTWTYISHVWVTRTLQDGLQNQWSFEVLDWEIIREDLRLKKSKQEMQQDPQGPKYKNVPSVNIAARCRLTLYVFINPDMRRFEGDPIMYERVVTEVGAFEKMSSMPTAMAIASAVSRGLCRCVMRMFGIGLDLYEQDDPTPTPAQAWTALKQFGLNQGIEWTKEFEQSFVQKLGEKGITKENLVDKFSIAYDLLANIAGKVVELDEMPDVE